ncbi:MAG TPA: DUF72 domain-containing protein, partial [Pyrinomonadaceae bacterium]|nr:DUF72 domain-containing protein [Pyrinomonadaceae bacterium]
MKSLLQVGCQGWNYEDWVTPPGSGRAVFYPRGTRAPDMLDIYARAFDTVEVDSTFYATPSEPAVDGWAKRTPDSFTFALKLPQAITHTHALRGQAAREGLEEFCARARRLGPKLAAVLVQLPPQFEATRENAAALAEFLTWLPTDLRFAFELRDPFWFEQEWLGPLAARPNVTLALVEGRWATRERVWRAAAAGALKTFCERARRLGPKLAAVLVQFPPQFEATRENAAALADFLPLLPADIRFAVELRDPFWFEEELLEP